MFSQMNQFNGQVGTSPLLDMISSLIQEYASQAARSGVMSQFETQSFVTQFMQYAPQIAQQISQQYPQGGSSQIVQQAVSQYGNQLLQQMRAQSGGGYNQPQQQTVWGGAQNRPMTNYQGGFNMSPNVQPRQDGLPSMYSPNQTPPPHPQQQPPPQQQVPPQQTSRTSRSQSAPPKSGPLELLPFGNTPRQYQFTEDPQGPSLSTKCGSGPTVEVQGRTTISDDLGEKFHYNRVTCYIAEPSVKRVIENFARTNPKLCTGKWISLIHYNTFDLRAMKARDCQPIDLTSLDDIRSPDLPKDNLIQQVLISIEERDFGIVSVLEELILTKFNDRMKRFVRLADDINQIIQVNELKDIAMLAGYRDRDFGQLTYHHAYEDTVLKCFRDAVREVISASVTPKGFYDAEEIAPSLLAHPKFVIRDNGYCEREMDLTNASFINAIKARYTAFSMFGDIAVANFIPGEPGELAEDLDGHAIMIENTTSPIDALISRVWTNIIPEAVLLTEGDEKILLKIGQTLDGGKFIYRDDVSVLDSGE